MLADDELDFDYDLGDLGDLGDLESSAFTTEELERQLGLDLDIDLEPIADESASKNASNKDSKADSKAKPAAKEEVKKTEVKKEEAIKTEDKKAEVQDKSKPDQEEKKQDQDQTKKYEKRAIPSTHDSQYNNYKNNRKYNNNNQMNYYAMQQQAMFYPQMQANYMAMNGMFPYQQPQAFNTPNRIYVNPNFKGRPPNQMMGRQQMGEAYKAHATKQNMSDEQKAQEELLDKKRKEAAESLRKRLASKKHEGGTKRKNTDGPTSEAKRPAIQPTEIKSVPAKGGFSIRGAAKAKASEAKASEANEEKSSNEKPVVNENIRKLLKPAIASRLARRDNVSPMTKQQRNGKSNAVKISNLSTDTTVQQLKTLVGPFGTNEITYKQNENTATVLFESIEEAVKFRRLNNRTKFADNHITVSFEK